VLTDFPEVIAMKFTERLREKASPIWEAEMRHPFVLGIGEGTLPLEKFKFYVKQDYVFLVEFSKVFAWAVTKTTGVATMAKFAELLDATLHTEMELHRGYAKKFGIPPEDLEQTQAAPTCYAYTRHLLQVAATGTLAELVAALLPCAWGYCEIAARLAARGEPKDQPLYAEWIRMYSSAEFAGFAQWLRDLLDSLAEGLKEGTLASLEAHFLTSSRYEYLFWEMAWREESWPV